MRVAPCPPLFTEPGHNLTHDGRFATLRDVLDHCDHFFKLRLTEQEERGFGEYLKSVATGGTVTQTR